MNQPSELSCSISIFQLQTVAPIRRYPIETRVGAFQISKFPTASSYHDSEHTGAGPLELMTDPVRMARQDLFSFKMRYRISLPCFPFPSSDPPPAITPSVVLQVPVAIHSPPRASADRLHLTSALWSSRRWAFRPRCWPSPESELSRKG